MSAARILTPLRASSLSLGGFPDVNARIVADYTRDSSDLEVTSELLEYLADNELRLASSDEAGAWVLDVSGHPTVWVVAR